MAGHSLLPKGKNIARRFQSLAERRRRHLLELYRTGRWRHYCTEDQLASDMREADGLVDHWKRFAEQEATAHDVESAGIAPHEPPEYASIQPDVEPTDDYAPLDRPITLLHD